MFWAHYDDDLVFANPTLLHALDSGRRAHSCFFTASDAGAGLSGYVDGRETGIRAAYDNMRGETEPGRTAPWSCPTASRSPSRARTETIGFAVIPSTARRWTAAASGYAATGRQSLGPAGHRRAVVHQHAGHRAGADARPPPQHRGAAGGRL